jgi:hypothetical protein
MKIKTKKKRKDQLEYEKACVKNVQRRKRNTHTETHTHRQIHTQYNQKGLLTRTC